MSEVVYSRLQNLIDKEAKKRPPHHVLLGVQSRDKQINFIGAAGDISPDMPYFIASVTKMYTVTILMQLVDEHLLDLDASIAKYLPLNLIDGVHIYEEVDYTSRLAVYQLIHQTSGLADYFEDKPANGKSLLDELKQGQDREYDVSDVIKLVQQMTPKFAPGTDEGKKSNYSDTNYQLLGAIIESITGKSIAENYQERIVERLGLTQTYLYDRTAIREDPQPIPFYNKEQVMRIPKMLSSDRAAGGIVSTLPESLRFLRAYFEGELFHTGHFQRMMTQWNTIFFPVQYGYGLMRFQLPRYMTLFRYSPELIGHSGVTGSFAFYAPKEQCYMAGTFNQVDKPARPFQFMLKVVNATL